MQSSNEGYGFVVDNDLEILAKSLENYDSIKRYNIDPQYYEDLLWGGLTHVWDENGNSVLSEWFINKFPNAIDRQWIRDRINIELSGKDVSGRAKSQKGF